MKPLKKLLARLANIPWIRFTLAVFRSFDEDNGTLNAAGLAFFMLLSFAPMILASVAILSRVIDPESAVSRVQVIVDNLLPLGGAQDEMHRFVGRKLSKTLADLSRVGGLASFIGLLTLIWTSMQIFVTGSTAMNRAFDVSESRSWVRVRLVALGLLTACGVLLLVSLALSGVPSAMRGDMMRAHDMAAMPPIMVSSIFEGVAVLVNALLFLMIYKFLPASKPSWQSAFVGGVAASLLFEVAKKGIAVFLLRPNDSIYGGLANLIVFILWIYYSMIILLLGAEVAALVEKRQSPSASRTRHLLRK